MTGKERQGRICCVFSRYGLVRPEDEFYEGIYFAKILENRKELANAVRPNPMRR